MRETDIQSSICEYLAIKQNQGKLMFWRQSTSGAIQAGHFVRKSKYARNGVPDIIVIKDGWFIGLEVKTPTGRQSKAQKEMEADIKKNGGEYYLVTSIEDLQTNGL